MKIIGTTLNAHDHNWYDGKLHYQAERYTRKKRNIYYGDCSDFYQQYVKSYILNSNIITSFSYTGGGIRPEAFGPEYIAEILPYLNNVQEHYDRIYTNLWDYHLKDNIYYINHHQSHAAYAFLSSQYTESDILAIDGGGTGGYNSVFYNKTGDKINISKILPIGFLWNLSCHFTNFSARDAGKLMGLAAYGKLNDRYYNTLEIITDNFDRIGKSYNKYPEPKNINAEDIAFTMQQYTLDKIQEVVLPLKTSNNICIVGGVAYNGYMNEMFTKYYDNVYVPPAPGDEGQSLGNYMHAEYMLNGNIHIPSVYNGQEYDINNGEIDYDYIAQAIADGAIIGWFQGKSESGNRALGNRSILADPRNPDIKDIINSKIKLREDFRPFAPSVLEEHYQEYFDTNQPSPYMSRIMPVISDKIPGVTHIDGTARIQTVTLEQNEKYYKLIKAFHNITGIPMLVNTSFNCQEPIVETPEDAMKTFKKTGLDMVVIGNEIIKKRTKNN
jgi:carbamoyltransferase